MAIVVWLGSQGLGAAKPSSTTSYPAPEASGPTAPAVALDQDPTPVGAR
ncbi:MAG: hypothetical protein R2702_13030 [Acidimicrobiales bacterium]